jgi:hypothetical protein
LLSGSLSSLGAVVESCYGDISFALYERKHLLPASELVYIASVSTLGKKNRPSHPSRTESETAHVMRFRTLIALFHTVILVSNCFLFFWFLYSMEKYVRVKSQHYAMIKTIEQQ